MTLRVLRDETPPLSRDDLQERGNKLVTDARIAAINAVRESMHEVFLGKIGSVTPARLREWRYRARTARDAWQRVDDIISELLREVDKASREQATNQSPDQDQQEQGASDATARRGPASARTDARR